MFYATDSLAEQIFIEYNEQSGSMLPALRQLGNVAALPGIVGCSLGMPDLHSGYPSKQISSITFIIHVIKLIVWLDMGLQLVTWQRLI